MKFFLLLIFTSSCAHYSMHPTSEETIYVPPITVEAENDIDGSSLARKLIARLEYLGHHAKYGASKNVRNTLFCHVLSEQIDTSANLAFVQLRLRCTSAGVDFSERISESANVINGDNENTHILLQSAANDAVENIAVQLSQHFISKGKKQWQKK